jgi:PAS domain S-box-containing protein
MNKKYRKREGLTEKKAKPKKSISVLDASVKKIADEPLFFNNEIYRLLFENVSDVIIILDTSLRIMRVSPSIEHILGYRPEELTGKKFTDINLVIPNDLERAILKTRSVLSGERIKPVIYGFYAKDGSMKISETSMVPLYNDNRIIGVSLVAKDIINRNIYYDESKYTMNKLRKALGGVIQAMAFTIESRDPCTAGHQRQVSNLARAIAIEMGISRDQTDGIRIVGSIHDIGKLSIPAEILSRPGRISDIEFNLIREHPRVGYEILKTIDFPWPVAETVLQHHERIDGSGYPQGLSGKDILIESKIIAVADVVEAMSSHRPHRASLGIDKALKEISENSGILYDPRVVDSCISIIKKQKLSTNFEKYII